ncbi:MurR/RpiR family transcriptional regulator [Succinivibrio dextrinosolvens]|jgi:DNA-binding MurR/RpiR family transcriptional regulator|uniref:MurR/RpiR family transcriptional regulator n=1 Tax=Succinivibrio dextrinosolvens TaxID=83771 RepID=UPI001923238D|nr:MurR/RpiR family transcriptional regulator [Succinivibrio dextrinosolvens]
MSILRRLSNPQIKASKSDNKLIHYFLANGLKACSSSISEISADCDISHATVTRFARKFGFETLKDFKIALAQDLGAQDNDSHGKRTAINLKESCETTAQKLLQLNQTLLSQTAVEIGFESVTKLTREIVGARHVFFFGIGSSGYLARDAARKIARIGIDARCYTDSHEIMTHSAMITNQDVAIYISNSGQTPELVKSAALCSKKGAMICAITAETTSPLYSFTDITVLHAVHDYDLAQGYSDSRLSVFFIIDLIYIELIKLIGEKAIKQKQETQDAIESLSNSD